MSAFDIKEKKILITGTTSGIGREMSKHFNGLGAELFLLGRNVEKLSKLEKELNSSNFSKLIKGDLNKDLEEIASEIENVDGIVFNAGVVSYQPLKFLKEEEFLSLFQTNYFSSIFLLKKLIKKRKINKGASIVFISSLSASIGVEGTLAYSASKASIDSSIKVLASELSRQSIRVNSIAPGIIETPLLNNEVFNKEKRNQEEAKYPLGIGEPKDVVYSAQFLLSDASKWITGSVLDLNGGYKLK